MSTTQVADRVEIKAASVSPSTAVTPAQVLQGNELIELSIKPSLWYIPLVSGRVVLAMLILAGAVMFSARLGWNTTQVTAVVACLLIAVGRVAVAALQWASRLYVLTNRRVMYFHGVLNVVVEELPLAKISEIALDVPTHQRVLWIGTLRMTPAAGKLAPIAWRHINQPQNIYRKVKRAVQEAQGQG